MSFLQTLFINTLDLYLDAAPWLLLGLLAAGLIKAWVDEAGMARWLGGNGVGAVTRAALIGAPLPLCSCGVLPAALGLRRGGASRGSTVSFLIATPETGVDSVAITYALMGPFMAVVRPVAAIFSAVVTGLAAGRVTETVPALQPAGAGVGGCGCACSCGDGETTPAPDRYAPPWAQRTVEGVRYAASDIVDDLALWLAGGLLLAGALVTWLPPQALATWGSGLPAMLLMLVIGVPMYICATASTPLAASLLLVGLSPGTVLVFLLAGPATNLATLGLLHKELGGATMTVYLAGIAIASLACGIAVDSVVAHFGIDIIGQVSAGAEAEPGPVAWLSALLLAMLALKPLRRLWLGR